MYGIYVGLPKTLGLPQDSHHDLSPVPVLDTLKSIKSLVFLSCTWDIRQSLRALSLSHLNSKSKESLSLFTMVVFILNRPFFISSLLVGGKFPARIVHTHTHTSLTD